MRRALAASRSALVLNLRANSLPCAAMPLAICSARDVLQRHLHAAGDAPAGDVGAHGAGADDVHAARAPAELLRRLPFQQLRQPEHAAQIARLVGHHQRREGARLGGLHRLVVAAVALEQIDQPVGRRIVVLARLLAAPRRACVWRASRAPATWTSSCLAKPGRLRLAIAQNRLARRPGQRAAAVDELVDEAHAARGRSRQHLGRSASPAWRPGPRPGGSSAPCR